MILRLIIFILIGFLIYHLIRLSLKLSRPVRGAREEAVEMVLDQNCGRYILKRDALRLKTDGTDIFFCSQKCMDDFRRGGQDK